MRDSGLQFRGRRGRGFGGDDNLQALKDLPTMGIGSLVLLWRLASCLPGYGSWVRHGLIEIAIEIATASGFGWICQHHETKGLFLLANS